MAKQLTADEESILKRQSRRRLIGAVALISVVVITLPLVFDGEPASKNASDIELRIPDKDNAGEFKPQAGLPEVAAVSSVAAASATAASPEASSPPVPLTVPAPHIDGSKAAPVKPVTPQHTAEGKAKVEPKKADTRKVEAKPAPKTVAVPHSGFVVQVGAFANAGSAKGLQEKLSKQGFHAYIEKTGDKVRVRVGAYPSREAAEKARHKLESLGLHPNVINLG